MLSYVLSDAHYVLSPLIRWNAEADPPAYEFKGFASWVSETLGTFIFVFLFMICTDKETQFSKDKVINCFIMAASYVAARAMSGGKLVTALVHSSSRAATSGIADDMAADAREAFNKDLEIWQCGVFGTPAAGIVTPITPA